MSESTAPATSNNTLLVVVIVAALLAVGVYAYAQNEKKKQSGNNTPVKLPGGGTATPHQIVQNAINEILSDPAQLKHFNTIKVGGSEGVPATSATVKPMVLWEARKRANLLTTDGWETYNYPGLAVNEKTTAGLARDRTFKLSDVKIEDVIAVVGATMAGGPIAGVGTAAALSAGK